MKKVSAGTVVERQPTLVFTTLVPGSGTCSGKSVCLLEAHRDAVGGREHEAVAGGAALTTWLVGCLGSSWGNLVAHLSPL